MQAELGGQVRAVQADYGRFAAKASLNYLIKDKVTATAMGINTTALYDSGMTDLWCPLEYRVDEFKVLRETGVDRKALVRSFRRLTSSLCVAERVMLEIQYAWLDASLPMSWWEGMHKVGVLGLFYPAFYPPLSCSFHCYSPHSNHLSTLSLSVPIST